MTYHHWDFFGPDALGSAQHFHKHVSEFATTLKIIIHETGLFSAQNHHTCFWISIEDSLQSDQTQKKLRPRRSLSPFEHHELIKQIEKLESANVE